MKTPPTRTKKKNRHVVYKTKGRKVKFRPFFTVLKICNACNLKKTTLHVKKRQLGKATEEKYTKSLYGCKKFARFCANALKTLCKQLFFKCVFTLETKVIIAVRCMFVYPDTKTKQPTYKNAINQAFVVNLTHQTPLLCVSL